MRGNDHERILLECIVKINFKASDMVFLMYSDNIHDVCCISIINERNIMVKFDFNFKKEWIPLETRILLVTARNCLCIAVT